MAAPSRSRCPGVAAGTARAAAKEGEGEGKGVGRPRRALLVSGGSGGLARRARAQLMLGASPAPAAPPRVPTAASPGGCSRGWRVRPGPAVRAPPVSIATRTLPTSWRPRSSGHHREGGTGVVAIPGNRVEVFPQHSGIRSGQPSRFHFSLPRKIGHLELSFPHHRFADDKKLKWVFYSSWSNYVGGQFSFLLGCLSLSQSIVTVFLYTL